MQGHRRPFSTLQRHIRREVHDAIEGRESCELCSESIPLEHRHLLEVATREIRCVCRACSMLFDTEAARGGKYRLVPDRRLCLEDFHLDEAQWESLHLPVDLAFFFYSTPAQRVVVFYPSPMGATESLLDLHTWEQLKERHVILSTLQHDVEALLVYRARGARQYFVVPLDECYRLVGLMRLYWRGLSGGQKVWTEIGQFFETLRRRAQAVRREAVASAHGGQNEATLRRR
jgi:Family of unknown function (DUF5947)